jgi:hypothetical protein
MTTASLTIFITEQAVTNKISETPMITNKISETPMSVALLHFTNKKKQSIVRRMPSCGMLHRVALVRTDVLEELSASIIRVTRMGELGTLAVTSNRTCIGCWLTAMFLVHQFLSP